MSRAIRKPWILNVALLHEGDECLLWPFSTRGGRARRGDAGYPALDDTYGHIFLCELVHGSRPTPHHEVEHLCGTRLCMNPRHVAWATHAENCARRTDHGTQTIGVRHGMVKLTDAQVIEIIDTPLERGTGVTLARRFGVSYATISRIRHGTSWKHLQERRVK